MSQGNLYQCLFGHTFLHDSDDRIISCWKCDRTQIREAMYALYKEGSIDRPPEYPSRAFRVDDHAKESIFRLGGERAVQDAYRSPIQNQIDEARTFLSSLVVSKTGKPSSPHDDEFAWLEDE